MEAVMWIGWLFSWFAGGVAWAQPAPLQVGDVRLGTTSNVRFGHVPTVRATLADELNRLGVPAVPWDDQSPGRVLHARITQQVCAQPSDCGRQVCPEYNTWTGCTWSVRFFVVEAPGGAPIAWADGHGQATAFVSTLTDGMQLQILRDALRTAHGVARLTPPSGAPPLAEPPDAPPVAAPVRPAPLRVPPTGAIMFGTGLILTSVGATVAVASLPFVASPEATSPADQRAARTLAVGGLAATGFGVALMVQGPRQTQIDYEAAKRKAEAERDPGR